MTSEIVERFLAERRAAGYTNYVTARAMAPLLGYLRGLGVAPAASPRLAIDAVDVPLTPIASTWPSSARWSPSS